MKFNFVSSVFTYYLFFRIDGLKKIISRSCRGKVEEMCLSCIVCYLNNSKLKLELPHINQVSEKLFPT